MTEVTLYKSQDQLFIFQEKEECEYYDSLPQASFSNPFLVTEDIQFVLLDTQMDENKKSIRAVLKSLEHFNCDGLIGSNHYALWTVTYEYPIEKGVFSIKSSLCDFIYSDIDVISNNPEGWNPYWDDLYIDDYAKKPKEFALDAFINYVKEVLINYFTAFGHLEKIKQDQVESPASINELYGFLMVKKSKFTKRISELEKKISEIRSEKRIGNLPDTEEALNRTKALIYFIEQIETFL